MWANFVFFYNFTDFLQNLEARIPQVLLMTLKFRIGISFEQGGDEEIFWHFKLFVMLKSILHKYWSTINKNYLDMFAQKKWNKQTNKNRTSMIRARNFVQSCILYQYCFPYLVINIVLLNVVHWNQIILGFKNFGYRTDPRVSDCRKLFKVRILNTVIKFMFSKTLKILKF